MFNSDIIAKESVVYRGARKLKPLVEIGYRISLVKAKDNTTDTSYETLPAASWTS